MAYQGTIATNPKKTKCVYASLDGEIIHFYDIKENNISIINKIEKAYPRYKPEDNGGMSYSATASWESVLGYISIATTDKYVYALYSGKTYQELKEGGTLSLAAEQVRVFDWTGNIINTYKLDVPCRYITASNNDDRLWAIVVTPDINLIYFDLTNTSDNNYQAKDDNLSHNKLNTNKKEDPIVHNSVVRTDTNKTPSESKTSNLNIGKIRIGEKKELFIPLLKIDSSSSTSKDISLKDSITPDNQSVLSISITKQKKQTFSDTINIISDSIKLSLVLSGEAVE